MRSYDHLRMIDDGEEYERYCQYQMAVRDYNLCDRAAYRFETDPAAKDGVLFECFNTADAEKLKSIMAELHPEVPVFTKVIFDQETCFKVAGQRGEAR